MRNRLRPLRPVLIISLLGLVALLAAGCGGGGSSSDAKATIDSAFKHPIKSANVTLNLNAKVDGVAQLSQPISFKMAGPYQSNGKGKLPSLNWQISASGGGQSVSGGLILTGDNAYVSFQGSNYEVGKAQVAQINQQLATNAGKSQSLKTLGIDPASWVTDAQDKGTETVNGVETTHVQAGLDVGKMLNDLNKTIGKAGGAMGSTTTRQLTPTQIDQIKSVLKDPKFDVYVGKNDDTLRRLNVSLQFSVPEGQRSQVGGATGGNITFSLDFADVGQPQTITAPPNPKPISELSSQLGGLGLGGALGGSGSSGSGSSGSGSGSGSSGSGSSGSGSSPSSAQFQKYTKCIEQADPSNTAAIQKCSALLK